MIIAGVGVLLAGVAAFLWLQERAFLAHAVQTRGLVVEMRPQWSTERSGTSSATTHTPTYAPTFTFADREGREHRIESHSSTNPPSYRVGQNVDVFYPADAPDQAQLRGFFAQWGAPVIVGGLGAFFLLFGAVFMFLFTVGARLVRA